MSHQCIHLSPLTCGSSTSNPDSATGDNNKQQQIREHIIKKEEIEDETRELCMEYGSPSGPQQYWFFEHDMVELEQMTTRCACVHCTAQSPGSTIPQQEKEVRFMYQLLTIPAKPKPTRVPRSDGTNLASSRISQCPISLVPETVEICSDCGLAKKSLPNLRLKDSQYYALMALFQLKYPNVSKEELTHFCKRNHICLKLRKLIMNWFQKMQTHFVANSSTSALNPSQIDPGTVQVEGIKQEPEEEEQPESNGPIPAQVPLPPFAWFRTESEEAAVLEHDSSTIPTVPGTQLAQDDPEVTERVQLDSPEFPELQSNVQEPKPTVPELKPTVPEPEPTIPEPEPTFPEPESTIPEPEPTFPEPEPTVPEPKPTVPEPEPTVPEPEQTVPEPEPTVPEPQPTVPESEPTVPVTPEVVPEPVAPPSSRPPRRLAFLKCDQTLDLMMVYGLLDTRNPAGNSPKRRAPRRSNSIRHNNKRTRN